MEAKEKKSRLNIIFAAGAIMIILFALSLWCGSTLLDGDIKGDYHDDWTWKHTFMQTMIIIFLLGSVFTFIYEMVSYNDKNVKSLFEFMHNDEEKESDKPIRLKRILLYAILIVIGYYSYGVIKSAATDSIRIYNTSKMCQNAYNRKIEEKRGFYDKLWKTYLQKEKITNINKETFLKVTSIIMENRKDGANITWKWLHENQQIPYDEFTKFYEDLSDFITSQREGYFNIEKECQVIAQSNNTLLDTFPNNLYNRMLKCPRIKFQYGFTSDSTDSVFDSGKENLK